MSQPYVGEIRMFAGNFAPSGWMFCNGQTLPISEYEVLFTLIGTTYGGDGEETFQLPNLQSRVPVHQGNGFVQGEMTGEETVTVTVNQLPSHTHTALTSSKTGNQSSPEGGVWSVSNAGQFANTVANNSLGDMAAGSIGPAGGSQPHDNLMPYLCIHFIISPFGIFPSQN